MFSKMPSKSMATATKCKYFSFNKDFEIMKTIVLSLMLNVVPMDDGPFLHTTSMKSLVISRYETGSFLARGEVNRCSRFIFTTDLCRTFPHIAHFYVVFQTHVVT